MPQKPPSLLLPYSFPLEPCVFLKRYKRFFADVRKTQSDGQTRDNPILSVHCANSGSMQSCLAEGAKAYILDSRNPKRALSHTLELLELEDGFACVNTQRANQFVESLLTNVLLGQSAPYGEFSSWQQYKREAPFGDKTRFDFCLTSPVRKKKCWIEVKSVSLRLDESAWAFPDAVTTRGQKHLQELMRATQQGDDAFLFFVLMRASAIEPKILKDGFRTAHEIDLKYSKLLEESQKKGVRVALVIPSISPAGFGLRDFNIFIKL